jgi:hypothetical protein
MERITLRIFVAALTFIVGLTASWVMGERSRPKAFTPTARGCGMGYGQAYAMSDGRAMSEGSACFETSSETKRKWRNLLAKAKTIVERVPQYKNRFGQMGERVVALFPPDQYNEETARIMWYDGGECYLYISAPTLDIALEFEKSNAYAY